MKPDEEDDDQFEFSARLRHRMADDLDDNELRGDVEEYWSLAGDWPAEFLDDIIARLWAFVDEHPKAKDVKKALKLLESELSKH